MGSAGLEVQQYGFKMGLHPGQDFLPAFDNTSEVSGAELETRRLAVHPNAEVGKTHRKQRGFRGFHTGQQSGFDRPSSRDAGGQAGVSGLVPGEQPCFAGQTPHIGFGKAALPERGPD